MKNLQKFVDWLYFLLFPLRGSKRPRQRVKK